MMVQTHLVVNLAALGAGQAAGQPNTSRWVLPVALGALLPHGSMVVFYAVERLRGVAESQIWTTDYFLPAWQAFFHASHSLPLAMAGVVIALVAKHPRWAALFASMELHGLVDLLVPHDNGHLFSAAPWQVASPVAYWDPAHFGQWLMPLEVLVYLICLGALWGRSTRTPRPARRSVASTAADREPASIQEVVRLT